MARAVEDLAPALRVISGPDWMDSAVQDVPLRDPEGIAMKGLRIAFHTANGIMPARADVATAVAPA